MQYTELLKEFGIAGGLLFMLFKLGDRLVKYFCATISAKDKYISELVQNNTEATKSFNTTMNNHIDHETKAREKEARAFDELSKAIGRWCDGNDTKIKIRKIK